MLAIFLMLFFFVVDLGLQLLFELKITPEVVGGQSAHDAYLSFFGIAMGILRGMVPDQTSVQMKPQGTLKLQQSSPES